MTCSGCGRDFKYKKRDSLCSDCREEFPEEEYEYDEVRGTGPGTREYFEKWKDEVG